MSKQSIIPHSLRCFNQKGTLLLLCGLRPPVIPLFAVHERERGNAGGKNIRVVPRVSAKATNGRYFTWNATRRVYGRWQGGNPRKICTGGILLEWGGQIYECTPLCTLKRDRTTIGMGRYKSDPLFLPSGRSRGSLSCKISRGGGYHFRDLPAPVLLIPPYPAGQGYPSHVYVWIGIYCFWGNCFPKQ